jgi:hypothetical protein
MTLDLETRPVGTPLRLARPTPAVPAPASPPDVPAAAEQPVDLTDHAASYWVRRRRAQAATGDAD